MDHGSISLDTMTRTSEEEELMTSLIDNHDAAKEFQSRESVTTSRSILKIQPEHLPYNLTLTTIAGPGMISAPRVFSDDGAGSMIAFFHLGRKLAGHNGVVHGGLSAILLDECLGRACFPLLPGKIAVTAKLDLEYKSPIFVDSVVLVRCETTEVQGRKAWVKGVVEDARDGRTLVRATALYIEPRWAASMSKVL